MFQSKFQSKLSGVYQLRGAVGLIITSGERLSPTPLARLQLDPGNPGSESLEIFGAGGRFRSDDLVLGKHALYH